MDKKHIKNRVLAIVMVIFTAGTVSAQSFESRSNGAVAFDDFEFPSFTAYTNSDKFRQSGMRCGTEGANQRLAERLPNELGRSPSDCTQTLTRIQNEYSLTDSFFEIPVWFHVISRTDGVGNVTNANINAQMVALNEDFSAIAGSMGQNGFNTKIVFKLEGVTRTVNNSWFTDSNADELAYKVALAKDPNKYLNVYTNDARGNLGYAYFPQAAGQFFDGVVMAYQTITGRNGSFGPYNQGRTLVHEIGHYLGLQHTFQQQGITCGNTFTTGDVITDTNAEASEHYGCAARTTCGTPDPIDNYMDYSDDICMARFTSQQANRMICGVVNYRAQLAVLKSTSDSNPIIVPVIDLLLSAN